MHKKLEAELVSLAHSILQMKNNADVSLLHKKAHDIYEKLSVLKFVDAYINAAPIEVETEAKKEVVSVVEEVIVDEIPGEKPEIIGEEVKEEVINVVEEEVEEVPEIIEEEALPEEKLQITSVVEEIIVEDEPAIIEVEEIPTEEKVDEVVENEPEVIEEIESPKKVYTHKEIEEIFEIKDEEVKDDVRDLQSSLFTLEDEFKDAISSDVATELFEKVTKENPVVVEKPKEPKSRSLNDAIFNTNLQIGLNDRIAFVKHLFEGSQEDFNRVLSQLNSFNTESESKEFLQSFVKLDYDWSGKEEYETRFMDIIERKFL